MSTGHKVLIAVGALIFVLMIATASFSLGVYVGTHGWTRQGLRLQGPGGAPPPQPRPDDQRPGAGQQPPQGGGLPAPAPQQGLAAPDRSPNGEPVLRGRIRALSTGSILLITPQGPRTVIISQETQVERDGERAELTDLRSGQDVAIIGDLSDGGQTLWAKVLVIRR